MELIRFYFGSSSNLLKALLQLPFENTSLVKWHKQFDRGRVYLRLADGMSGSRDKFIKDSIHEINTPLNVIQANIELLRLGDKQQNLVKIEAGSKIISGR